MPEIAFAGRSNVGKSSALNTLLDVRGAARVSSRPGRTQLLNLFQIGDKCVFVDLPGYGYAAVPDEVSAQWGEMIESYLGEREELRVVVVLIDARREALEMDAILLDGLRDADIPYLVVATKLDKLPKHQRKPALQALRVGHELPEDQPVGFSSKTRDGVAEVWRRLNAACRRP